MEVGRAIDAAAVAGELRAKAREHALKALFLEKSADWYASQSREALMGMADGALWDNAVRPATPGVQGSFRAAEW